jgi:4-amino-4-deoxy-L-arabinose transferase-like glycosyltransferase
VPRPPALLRIVLVVSAVALTVRLLHLAVFRGSPFYLLPPLDGDVYLTLARNPLHEVFFCSPGYIYFLKLILLVSDGPFLFRLIDCLLGAGTAALTAVSAAYLARNRWWALVAGLAIALYGPLVAADVWPLSESTTAFWHAAALAASLTAARPDTRHRRLWLALAGLALGLAIVWRPTALLLVPVLALYAWRIERRVRDGLLSAALALLVVAPVTLHNLRAGDFVMVTSTGGFNFFLGNARGAIGLFRISDEMPGGNNAASQLRVSQEYAERLAGRRPLRPSEVSSVLYTRARQDIARAPGDWLKVMGKKLLLTFNDFEAPSSEDFYLERTLYWPLRIPFVHFGLLAPLIAIGFVAAARRRDGLLVIAFAVASLSTTVIFYYVGRYRLIAVPALTVLAALGGEWLLDAARARDRRRVVAGALLFVVMAGVSRLRLVDRMPAQEWTKLGTAAARLGRSDEASAALEHALALDPEDLQALRNLAAVRESQQHRPDEARALWTRLRTLAAARGDAKQLAAAEAALQRLR